MTIFDKYYQALNKEQRLAVDSIDGPLMVVAGPGTGKTQTLAMRIANILKVTDEDPSSILALTFTEAGARAMKSRLQKIIGTASYYVNITTFHGFCVDVIRNNPDLFPISPMVEPISDLRKNKLIEDILSRVDLARLKPLGTPGYFIHSILKSLSDLKREGYTKKTFANLVQQQEDFYQAGKDDFKKAEGIKLLRDLEKNQELLKIFGEYEQALSAGGDYDFDDMIILVATAFSQNEELLLTYQERYHYFLIDEYQDTNTAQNSVVDSLVSYWGEQGNIFVVGDPDQCIMRFQGASMENILGFRERYPNCKIICLKDNYRSGQTILDHAHNLINHNLAKITNIVPTAPNYLASQTKSIGKINHLTFTNGTKELAYLGQTIKQLITEGVSANEIAVIYRNNHDSLLVSSTLDDLEIPYMIQGNGDVLSDPIIRQLKKLLDLIVALRTNIDDIHLFTVLNYSYLGVDPLDVMRLTRYGSSHNLHLWEVVIDDQLLTLAGVVNLPPLQAFRSLLLSWQTYDAEHTASELVEKVFTESGLLNLCLSKDDSHLQIARVNAFFAEVKSMNSHDHELNAASLLADLTLMEKQGIKIADVSSVEGESGVTLTTAHSAKGLEWGHVFIYRCIDGVWGNNRNVNLITLPPQIIRHQDMSKTEKNEDERRLLYVAVTRAKESCTITSSSSYRQGGTIKETLPSMFLSEMNLVSQTTLETPASQDLGVVGSNRIKHDDESLFLSSIIKDFRLSPTALNTYLQCAYKSKLNNLLKVPRAKAAYLSLGTAVHAALEGLYKKLGDGGQVPTLDYLLSIFDQAISRETMRQKEHDDYQKKGREILSAYYHYYKSDLKPALYMEKFFGYGNGKIILDGDIELAGKVDRIDDLDPANRAIRIIDYKTGRPKTRGQIEGKTKDSDGGYYRQLVFYKLLVDLDNKFAKEMIEAQLDFVEPDEKGDFRRYTFTISKEEVEELKNTIRDMMKHLRALEFPRTTDYKICESCDFLDHCYPEGLPTE